MKTKRINSKLIIFTTIILIVVCLLIYYKEEKTNKSLPKRATFVNNSLVEGDDIYG